MIKKKCVEIKKLSLYIYQLHMKKEKILVLNTIKLKMTKKKKIEEGLN